MDDFQELVYNRLQTYPKGYEISVGDYGTVTKEAALQHVKDNDEIGQILIQIDRNYFDIIKSGKLYESLSH